MAKSFVTEIQLRDHETKSLFDKPGLALCELLTFIPLSFLQEEERKEL